MAMTTELDKFMELLSGKLDSDSCHLIRETLQVNGFTSRLQIKLISEKHLELMFQGAELTMGAKSLLNYHIQVLRDESPLQRGKTKKAQMSSPAAVDDQATPNSKQVSAPDSNVIILFNLKGSHRNLSVEIFTFVKNTCTEEFEILYYMHNLIFCVNKVMFPFHRESLSARERRSQPGQSCRLTVFVLM